MVKQNETKPSEVDPPRWDGAWFYVGRMVLGHVERTDYHSVSPTMSTYSATAGYDRKTLGEFTSEADARAMVEVAVSKWLLGNGPKTILTEGVDLLPLLRHLEDIEAEDNLEFDRARLSTDR